MTATSYRAPSTQIVVPPHMPGNVWVTVTKDQAGVHIVPTHDSYPHYAFNCACQPVQTAGGLQHNSFDQREYFENKIRKPS